MHTFGSSLCRDSRSFCKLPTAEESLVVQLLARLSSVLWSRIESACRRRLCLVSVLVLLYVEGPFGPYSDTLKAAEGPTTAAQSVPQTSVPPKSAPGQQAPGAPAKPSGSAEYAFRVVLADGAMVQLVGLCEYPSAGHDWWRPDGLPLGKIPSGEAPKEFKHRPFQGALFREVAIDATIPDGADVRLTGLNMTGLGGSSSLTKPGSGEKVVERIRAAVQLRPNSRTTLLVHYAPHPWTTLSRFKNWVLIPGGQYVRSGTGFVSSARSSYGVILSAPSEEKGSARIVAAFDLDDLDHQEVRMIAIDMENREHIADKHYQGKARGAHVLIAQFANLPLATIKEFHFQSREIQHIEFRNVSLHPGQKTNFAMFVEDQPYKPAAGSPISGNGARAKVRPNP
jgi:hypothetical protein